MKIEIGIKSADRKAIADQLMVVLADTYTLYLKTQNFHWNVTGPHFNSLHSMFETQYRELTQAVDEIAERIRSLGFNAPASFSRYLKMATVKEANDVPKADEMVNQLMHDHETLTRIVRECLEIAEKGKDQSTVDLMTMRLEVHEKTAWMLRSLAE